MSKTKKFLKRTDSFRRGLTKRIVRALEPAKSDSCENLNADNVRNVLVCRPNHRLGNQLLITPLVREIEQVFPNAKIDLFLKGNLGLELFKEYSVVDKMILLPKKHFKQLGQYLYTWIKIRSGKKYDLVVNVDEGSSSGRLATLVARGKNSCSGDLDFVESGNDKFDKFHFAKKPVYTFREFLVENGIDRSDESVPKMDLKLSEKEIEIGKAKLRELNGNDKPTIGIYTFATSNKCYSPEAWTAFYNQLVDQYGTSFNIVEILPIENVSQINFKATSFYGKDLRELAAIMNAMQVYISGDCGMMHLASATDVPVIGLFKFLNIDKYKPYGNGSVGIFTPEFDSDKILQSLDVILGNSWIGSRSV
ncbi:glycosyltransferase family 9 protein [Flavobacterium sp.]|uniref:glycosyltransferase family 9 protein n=1 Tax=Flavobacterium sp. TaxID=239 RepID=UPI0025C09314|nr:glycosyltransferase family 9 protein [Flavobacterium sp.]